MHATVIFLLLSLISHSIQQDLNVGYVSKTEYIIAGCQTWNAIRTMSFKVNACNPTFSVVAHYNPQEAKPFTLQYFSDGKCQQPTTQEFHADNECEVGNQTAVRFDYSSNLPTTEGLFSFAAYDPNVNACDGDLLFFQQTLPICYANSYGDFRSQKDMCQYTIGTTLLCYDTECNNCTTSSSTLSNTCDASSRVISSCGAPSKGANPPSRPTISPNGGNTPSNGTSPSNPSFTPNVPTSPSPSPSRFPSPSPMTNPCGIPSTSSASSFFLSFSPAFMILLIASIL